MSISQFIFKTLHPINIYLYNHPFAHYLLIFVTFTLLGILLFGSRQNKAKPSQTRSAFSKDISAIAGGDPMSSQLDLAKAYIEMNQKTHAKKMLKVVARQGSLLQQRQANQLLQSL